MTAAAIKVYPGSTLFSFGFRPFFLFGAAWAGLAVPVWALVYIGGGGRVLGAPGRDWHVHEMLFGYLAAVIAGFLLTAVPNWTGRPPITGRPLIALFGLWAAGRVAMLLQARLGAAAVAIDAMFLVVFAAVIWREILAGRGWRNLPVCAMVTLLALANVGFHLGGEGSTLAAVCERLVLAAPAMLIALIAGRIIPSFTRNWLAVHNVGTWPATFGRFDQAVLAATGVALLALICAPDLGATGALLIAAGVANAGRLARWRGLSTGRGPGVDLARRLCVACCGVAVAWPVDPVPSGDPAFQRCTRADRGRLWRDDPRGDDPNQPGPYWPALGRRSQDDADLPHGECGGSGAGCGADGQGSGAHSAWSVRRGLVPGLPRFRSCLPAHSP